MQDRTRFGLTANSFERYLFYSIILFHVLPVISLAFYVTHDGPAHLYNSNLINELLFSKSPLAANFFQFTPEVVPNWIGHFLLSLFNLFLPAPVAEKIFLTLYIILLPLSFRKLVLSINKQAVWASYFIFPFIQSFTFHIGFYSFSIGICILLFVIAWYKDREIHGMKQRFTLYVTMLILYFSHLFVFITAFFCIPAIMTWEKLIATKFSFRSLFTDRVFLNRIFSFVLASLVPLVLLFYFLLKQPSSGAMLLPDFATVAEWFSNVRPLIALHYEAEKIYARPLFYVYMVILAWILVLRFRKQRKTGIVFEQADVWLILSVIMLLAFFLMPDSFASGAVVGIRYCLMCYLFLFLFMAANGNRLLLLAGAFASVMVSFLMMHQRYPSLKDLSAEAKDFASCAYQMKQGSTLLPLNYSDNWMLDNISNYIGADKEIIVLDNYEASQVHFPLKWRTGRDPNLIVGNFSKSHLPCVDLLSLKRETGIELNYVLVMNKPDNLDDSCSLDVNRQLEKQYELIYTTPENRGKLYLLKNMP